jgi:hypothetical protein
MAFEPEIRIIGDRVQVQQGRETLLDAQLGTVLQAIACTAEREPSCNVLPDGIRLWRERGDATAVAVEIPPQTRTVRWLAEDSQAPFGRAARYQERFLAFPYIILLIVFRKGALTGRQQLYYRAAPLRRGQDLLLPNLYNVANGYGQRCWLCLQKLECRMEELEWPRKIEAIVNHVFTAAFNRSAEEHEGNSYWSAMKGIDPRIATVEAWEEATRGNPLFPLEVKWKPAGTTATAELTRMLDQVAAPVVVRNAKDLMGLMPRVSNRRKQA